MGIDDYFNAFGECRICHKQKQIGADGMCHDCTFLPPFVQSTDQMDGGNLLSYPPAVGSLTRIVHVGYLHCRECGGMGRIVEGTQARGCDRCASEFARHPLRLWYYTRRAAITRAERSDIMEASRLAPDEATLRVLVNGIKTHAVFLRYRLDQLAQAKSARLVGAVTTLKKTGKGNGKTVPVN